MEIDPKAQRVKDLVLASLQHSPEDRAQFIHAACVEDEFLENEVKS